MSNIAEKSVRRRLLRNAALATIVVPAALLAGCAPQPAPPPPQPIMQQAPAPMPPPPPAVIRGQRG